MRIFDKPLVYRLALFGVAGLLVAAFPGKFTFDTALLFLGGVSAALGLPDVANALSKGPKK